MDNERKFVFPNATDLYRPLELGGGNSGGGGDENNRDRPGVIKPDKDSGVIKLLQGLLDAGIQFASKVNPFTGNLEVTTTDPDTGETTTFEAPND
jgi:hypothetical protein